MNQQPENTDLQKAIDDITNNTNADPVFSDPVAAPSSIPEGDTGELGEPIGPFPEAKIEMVAPPPEPIAPLESANIPELNNLNVPAPDNLPMPNLSGEPNLPPAPEPTTGPAPTPTEPVAPEPVIEKPEVEPIPGSPNMEQLKKAALRDLVPVLDKININPSQKFRIYRDIFDDLKDYTVLEPAYKVAREIPDETERAEALLYLVESIDNM